MAKYPNIVITNNGLNLFAQSQGNGQLIFTAMKIGDGTLNIGDDIKALTNLKNPILTANISNIDTSISGQATLTAIINNSAVETGFFAKELGIYAKIGTNGTEQLYAYTNAANYADYMPDKNTPVDENKIEITLIIGNTTNVTAIINDSIIYLTKEDTDKNIAIAVAAHDSDDSAHKDIRQLINDIIKNIDLSPYAKLLSPEFSGIPTAPTASKDTDNIQIATTAFVKSLITDIPVPVADGIIAQSLDTWGWIKFANGFIVQWGQSSHPASGDATTFTYPLSMTTVLSASLQRYSTIALAEHNPTLLSLGTSSLTWVNKGINGNNAATTSLITVIGVV
ncbi:phage tail protein [Pectinatus frisingensis]|uniref:phage tail-collar fiber domain-containing protein n=1 Tax=Pectinatus frisingensis TaxID=865 RepID=UPI0018C6A260|nr:phage tail protein [Pectinatus frisingensis]